METQTILLTIGIAAAAGWVAHQFFRRNSTPVTSSAVPSGNNITSDAEVQTPAAEKTAITVEPSHASGESTSTSREKEPVVSETSRQEELPSAMPYTEWKKFSPIERINYLLEKDYRQEGYRDALRLNSPDFKWSRMEEMVGRVLLVVSQAINEQEHIYKRHEAMARIKEEEGFPSLAEGHKQQATYHEKQYKRLCALKADGEEMLMNIRAHHIPKQHQHADEQEEFNPFYVMILSYENGFQEGIIDANRSNFGF